MMLDNQLMQDILDWRDDCDVSWEDFEKLSNIIDKRVVVVKHVEACELDAWDSSVLLQFAKDSMAQNVYQQERLVELADEKHRALAANEVLQESMNHFRKKNDQLANDKLELQEYIVKLESHIKSAYELAATTWGKRGEELMKKETAEEVYEQWVNRGGAMR